MACVLSMSCCVFCAAVCSSHIFFMKGVYCSRLAEFLGLAMPKLAVLTFDLKANIRVLVASAIL